LGQLPTTTTHIRTTPPFPPIPIGWSESSPSPPASHVQLSTKKPIKLEINCAIVAAAAQRPGLPYGADFCEKFFLPIQHFVCLFCVCVRVFGFFALAGGFPFYCGRRVKIVCIAFSADACELRNICNLAKYTRKRARIEA